MIQHENKIDWPLWIRDISVNRAKNANGWDYGEEKSLGGAEEEVILNREDGNHVNSGNPHHQVAGTQALGLRAGGALLHGGPEGKSIIAI